MIGIVIAGHEKVSCGLLGAAETIMTIGRGVATIPYTNQERLPAFTTRLREKVSQVDEGDGVLVLTDLYGDTPTNAALRLTCQMNIEVVAGVNLPMLLEALTYRSEMSLSELASKAENRSRQCIVNAASYAQCHSMGR